MRISKIVLKNYRQYKNVELNFDNDNKNSLDIFIASNGIGKSNIMNAINWCLYNREPHLDDESRALPIVNIEALKEVTSGRVSIEVEIVWIMDDNSILQIRRNQDFMKMDKLEPFSNPDILIAKIMNRNDDTKIYECEEAQNLIDKFFPEGIREYFFFDGERLERYFAQSTGEKIEDAIANISNVSTLRTIKQRIGTIRDEKLNDVGKKSPNLTKLQQKHKANTEALELQKEKIKQINKQIDISKAMIDECNNYLQGLPNIAELEKEREKLKEELQSSNKQLSNRLKDLRDFSREYAIIIYSYNSTKKIIEKIAVKREKNELPPNISREFLYDILENDFCKVCQRNIQLQDKIQINKMLEQIKVSTETGNKLIQYEGVLKEQLKKLDNFTNKYKSIDDEIKLLREGIESKEKDIKKIDDKLINFSNAEEIKQKTLIRSHNEISKDTNIKMVGALENGLVNIEKDVLKSKDILEKAMEDNADCNKLKKEISLCEETIKYLEKIENKIMTENRKKIEKETKENFMKFIWKKNTFKDVILDECYNVHLIHREGYECIGSCSAAEKALLALSFTLALHKVSGFSSPLVIDTPVARVSDVNRENFAKVLVDVSKEKQIILLFTPSEYSDEIKNEFEANYSKKVILDHTDNGVVKIKGN